MSGENVARLHEEPTPEPAVPAEVPAPGIDISVIVAASDNRQIQLRTMLVQDTPLEIQNAVLDRLMALGDRQKARYDLDKLEEEFRLVGVTLTNLIDGLPHAERVHLEAQEKRTAEIKQWSEKFQAEHDIGYADFVKTGRQGKWEPKGNRKANMDRMLQAAAKVQEQMVAAEADRLQHRQELTKSVAHYQDDLGKRRKKLNALRALAGQEACAEFLDVETMEIPEA